MMGHDMPLSPFDLKLVGSRFWPWLLALLSVVGLLATATRTSASVSNTIRLHDQATVEHKLVRLGDVAELTGTEALAMADIVLTTIESGQRRVTLTLDQVQQTLDQHGAHWGKVTLRGYATCVVYETTPKPEPITAAVSPVVTNPHKEVDLHTAVTLRERVVELIEQLSGVDEDQLRMTFNPKDEKRLTQSAWQDHYEIQPLSASTLGRIPFVIRQYRNGQLVHTARITVDIARRYMAVVAKRAVGRNQTFAPGDVAIEEVYLDTAADQVATDLSEVIGFVAASVVRQNAVVRKQQIRSPTLVRRGELMTVRCISGDLVVKTVGRSTEDGVLDQTVQVRNDRTRERYPVRVTGPRTGMVTSLDTGEWPLTPNGDQGNSHP